MKTNLKEIQKEEEERIEAMNSSARATAAPSTEEMDSLEEEGDDHQDREEEALSKRRHEEFMAHEKESRVVSQWKTLVMVVLLVSTVGVALTVYFYTSRTEISEFKKQFHDDAHKVLEALGTSLDLSLGAIDALVVSMVSFAAHTNHTWPFVTIPDFAIRAAKIRSLSHAVFMTVYPKVSKDDLEKWEKYASENNDWVYESIEVQSKDDNYYGPIIWDYETIDFVHNYDNERTPGPIYLPTWQSSPVIPNFPPYNWDLYSTYDKSSVDKVLETKQVVISEAYMIPNYDDPLQLEELEDFSQWFEDYIKPGEEAKEPVSDIYYPIINKLDRVRIEDNNTTEVMGFLALSIYWRDLIKHIMPPGSDGIVVVFESPCAVFTYEIHGPDVVYRGSGDRHNTKFDNMERSSRLLELGRYSTRGASSYTGIPVLEEYCPMTVRVFPSDLMKNEYRTRNPIFFTVAAVLIFAFTSAVFLIYDHCVERRQRSVVNKAVQSKLSVDLLEKLVQERTRKLQISNKRLEDASHQVRKASDLQLRHFACMSHEIRTPLNCILGMSSVLLESELDPTQRDSMQMIFSSGELLRLIVDDVLDFSKLESGAFDIELRDASLQETLNTVVQSIESRGLVGSKRLEVRTFYSPDVGDVICTDHRRGQQILYNLLGNSVKFSKPDGVVELHVTYVEGSSIGERVLEFVVKDYGKGIAKKHFQDIFKPFNQAGDTTISAHGGTGLGLPITLKLVKGLSGCIFLDSEVGQWTEFRVHIPVEEEKRILVNSGPRLPEHAVVVLVEKDMDEGNARVVQMLQRHFGVNVITRPSMDGLWEDTLSKHRLAQTVDSMVVVCFVCEDAYNEVIHESLRKAVPLVLLTFGAKNKQLKKAIGQKRYRSLQRVLPSVLLKDMGDFISQAAKPIPKEITTNSSDVLLESDDDSPFRHLRILVAEDNAVNQKVLKRILARLDVTKVEIVPNGREAVLREACKAFDLVLMDMQMPVMDGLEACRKIIERPTSMLHPQAKVIFVTAHVSEGFERQCLEAGAVGYLSKPCNKKLVEECLAKFIQQQQPGSA